MHRNSSYQFNFFIFILILFSIIVSFQNTLNVFSSINPPYWEVGEISPLGANRWQEIYYPNGYVGIGTPNPGAPLEVNGNPAFDLVKITGNNDSYFYIGVNRIPNSTDIGAINSREEQDLIINKFGNGLFGSGKVGIGQVDPQYMLDVRGPIRAEDPREIFARKNIVIGDSIYFADIDSVDLVTINGMVDSNRGRIRLGNTGPTLTGERGVLFVEGEVRAQRLKVQQYVWADYVFSPDYELRDLSEVEQHIIEHQSLPGVPKASEVEGKTIDVADTHRLLLEKIEELTLYTIDQEKRLEKMEEELELLKQK